MSTVQPAGPNAVQPQTQIQRQARPEVQQRPKLTFDHTSHDFGKVDDLELQITEFEFRNEGDAPLNIIDVKSSCGCTVAELAKTRYEPGESGVISVSLKTQGREGNVGQNVTIRSDDPNTPVTRLSISADVIPLIRMEQNRINFGSLAKGESRTVRTWVIGPDEKFAITAVKATRFEAYDAKITGREIIEAEDPFTGETVQVSKTYIDITLRPDAPVGNVATAVQLATNDERAKELSLSAQATVEGDLAPMPARMTFGMVTPGEAFETRVRIQSKSGKPFKVLSAVPMIPIGGAITSSAAVEIVPVEGGIAFDIVMRGNAPDAPTTVRGHIVLGTDAAGETVLRVPVSGVVRLPPPSNAR